MTEKDLLVELDLSLAARSKLMLRVGSFRGPHLIGKKVLKFRKAAFEPGVARVDVTLPQEKLVCRLRSSVAR